MKLRIPYRIVAVLDILGRMWPWSDRDLAVFFMKLMKRKVQYLRVFTVCPWGKQTHGSQPFMYDKEHGIYDLGQWNEKFFEGLHRLACIAGDFGIALIVDLFDHCGTRRELRKKNPWYNNCNGVYGFYSTGMWAMKYQQDLIKKIVDTIGFTSYRTTKLGVKLRNRDHIYSLGNELYTPQNGASYHWLGRDWALPHSLYLRKLGYKGKIFFSADHWAGQAIRGYVSEEGRPWGSTFTRKDTVWQLHGVSYPGPIEDQLDMHVHGRWVGITDDGTHITNPVDRGICVNGNRFCSACKGLVCMTFKSAAEKCEERWGPFKTRTRVLHSIEQLPRSVSEVYQTLNNIDIDRDLNVWKAIGRAVYGKDWTRRTPKYLLRRYEI